jgi:hypothetical protein
MKQKKKLINIRKMFLILIIVGFATFCIFFISTSLIIRNQIKMTCEIAKKNYSGDCVEALIGMVSDEEVIYSSRNSAIWALGQLGDKRALQVLEKFYKGSVPMEREPWNGTLSQHELKKAIKLLDGGVNLTSIFWDKNELIEK